MTDQGEKKGIWSMLRRASSRRHSSKPPPKDLEPREYHRPRRASNGDAGQSPYRQSIGSAPDLTYDNNRPMTAEDESSNMRRRQKRGQPEPEPEPRSSPIRSKSSGFLNKARITNGRPVRPREPPTVTWPPYGISIDDELPQQHALEIVARGAPSHKGHRRPVAHQPDEFYSLHTTSSGNRADGKASDHTDAANLHDSMTQLMTLRLLGHGYAEKSWETLEQPSYAVHFGHLPGTITLNEWASMSSVLPPPIALRDAGVLPRVMSLESIFERLQELRHGIEDDDESLLYRILYKRILRDPDKFLNPHRTLDKQITDLILVLSRPDWIDFSNPRNQVATRFIFERGPENQEQFHKFFHQLLLSLELELRIQSYQHSDWAKEKLTSQIPPSIQWNLALARRWQDFVRVDDVGKTPEEILLRYKLKKRQIRMLRRFAQMMRWPNLTETLDNMKQKDSELALDEVSSDAFAFFSGLVLPGQSFPFLIMNTLLDLDPDSATDNLALLSHMHPHCGFQYKNSYTYWSASSIVGKVLAPTCHAVGGWIGPARPTTDLEPTQIARIRSRKPKQRMTPEDVESMAERSDPLGPAAETYPVDDYQPVTPSSGPEDAADTVRVELLSLKPAERPEDSPPSTKVSKLFDATVQFAINGVSWPLKLMYDVSFVAAWPCSEGPHPLFFDYVYKSIRVDYITGVRDWGNLYGGPQLHSVRSSPGPGMMQGPYKDMFSQSFNHHHAPLNGFLQPGGPEEEDDENDDEKVLVVEAFGVRDNEILARAWCSHWGLSAVVADVERTCMACAIREAYAATLTVVILVKGQEYPNNE
ncbi:uncharacterized protein B0J16DRAFT_175833 [Fusarium flagelliforme]|uniref:VTC domain-containing protein n=1 Tax=Fusarium flagelliforme TaxID=2675880 RepID=A0A395MIJ1_9HYPO|nr:uncharacterized protein B0J16DRAFT_175833 [Fusarium flagelliforme]KAH7179713.1 hypothetical protein B0J16DRAFT_175833 [Fusarium flagelliforme]RFN47083.1 hypothetical protein FIE12Z_8662 [Fusarium flagelliforme]